jgi:UDP-2,3-diacylglucosamine pyrophosphatase LpxH
VEHQGTRIYLAHGDGLASGMDSGYLLLRRVIRNRWVIRLLKLAHPDLAYALGHRLSKFSRNYLTARDFRIEEPLARTIDDVLSRGHDAFLMGHLHARHSERRPGGGRLFVLGDWITLFSALRLEDGRFQWEDWSRGHGVDVEETAGPVLGGHGD